MKQYRNNGATGAILDEYEKALNELIKLLSTISNEQFIAIADKETKDADCRSIQTILTHVVSAGYNYENETRKWLGENVDFAKKVELCTVEDYISELKKMFAFNEQLFKDYPNVDFQERNLTNNIRVRWGRTYDVEQLYEHAIVHILRHRRQIERFLLVLE